MSIIQDLFDINKQLAGNLYHISNGKSLNGGSPRLILPSKRDMTPRISEQESRVLYCNIITSHYSYYFSIETPTKQTYSFTGNKEISALSDLSLYEKDGNSVKKVANVEFKAHTVNTIDKDIQKLVRENITGNWFHTLKNANNGTLKCLFDKFKESLKKYGEYHISIVFCFCIIGKKWSCLKHFNYKPGNISIEKYTDNFFDLDHIPSNKMKNILVTRKNDWIIWEDEDYIKFLSIFHNKVNA